jgi:hypothetical protein
MIKVAEVYFRNQVIALNKVEDFFSTDVAKYFELLYGVKTRLADTGFIKIVKWEDIFFFFEHIFYDWAEEMMPEGETVGYISLEGIEFLPGKIQPTKEGKELSSKGYCIWDNSQEFIAQTLEKMPILEYSDRGCNSEVEASKTLKYNSKAWGEPSFNTAMAEAFYNEIRDNIENKTSFSPVLQSLDAFDMIAMEWERGRRILPHNDVDFRMMVNLVVYNTNYCDESRYLCVGEYDWYDYMFYSLITQDWEMTNNITASKAEKEAILVDTNMSAMINVSNPRFYHEVLPFTGNGKLYSAPSHLGFRKIVDNYRLVR